MRKKFFILWGRSLDSFVCFEWLERLEKFRFSLLVSGVVEAWEELNSCVMVNGREGIRSF